jgi:hypothetical protein
MSDPVCNAYWIKGILYYSMFFLDMKKQKIIHVLLLKILQLESQCVLLCKKKMDNNSIRISRASLYKQQKILQYIMYCIVFNTTTSQKL